MCGLTLSIQITLKNVSDKAALPSPVCDRVTVLFPAAGWSEICRGRCFVLGRPCGFIPGHGYASSPGRESINLPAFRKPQRSPRRKPRACCTPSVHWRRTWTGSLSRFMWNVCVDSRRHMFCLCAHIHSEPEVYLCVCVQVCGQDTVPALPSQSGGHGQSREALLLHTVSQDRLLRLCRENGPCSPTETSGG